MTVISPERDSLRAPGEILCGYCRRPIVRVDLINDRPWSEIVGPCCSDECAIIRCHNTPEWGGA